MNIYEKLLEVKKKVPYIQKDKKGFNYTYTTPGQVLGALNPLLNEQKVILLTKVVNCKSQRIEIIAKSGPRYEWLYDLDLEFIWVNTEKPEETIVLPWKTSGCNGEEKGLGSALTYAERYFMLKQFNIPTDDDDPDRFQDKHATPEEKQKSIQALQREQDEKKDRELADWIARLPGCKIAEDLTQLKKSMPPWVTANKDFRNASIERFNQINNV